MLRIVSVDHRVDISASIDESLLREDNEEHLKKRNTYRNREVKGVIIFATLLSACIIATFYFKHKVIWSISADENDKDDWGGWAHDLLSAAFDSSNCDIDILTEPIAASEFLSRYVNMKKPVLLRGKASQVLLNGWETEVRWTEKEFVARYGQTDLSTDTTAATVAATLESMHTETPKLFAWTGFHAESITRATSADYRLPQLYAEVTKGEQVRASVLISAPGAGAGWHNHDDALNILVAGRKRWFLAPLSSDATLRQSESVNDDQHEATKTMSGYVSQRHFFKRVYPKLKGSPLAPASCVQRKGDALYVPREWLHSTLSIGATVCVSFLRNVGWGIEVGEARTNN